MNRPRQADASGMSTVPPSLLDLRVSPQRIMGLIKSGLGLKEILRICPDVRPDEVKRVMGYVASMAFAHLNTNILPAPPAVEEEAPAKKEEPPGKPAPRGPRK